MEKIQEAPEKVDNIKAHAGKKMPTLGIVILTRDRPEALEKTLSHHYAILGGEFTPIYVYDNSVKEDASELCKKFPKVKYHRHTTDLSFDESVRFALKNTPTDFVWVISERTLISVGTVPLILDHLIRFNVHAVLVGFGGRLQNIGTAFFDSNPANLLKTVGWHTTLLGSTVYSRELIDKALTEPYMGYGFIHMATLWDGLTRIDKPMVLVLCSHLCSGIDDYWPKWLPFHIKIWTNDLRKMFELLPKNVYSDYVKERAMYNNGYNGSLLAESNFYFLANHGAFSVELLNKYWKDIRRVCMIPYKRLYEIAQWCNNTNEPKLPWWKRIFK